MLGRDEFREWIDAYHGALFRHALWMTGDRELAADLVQETYYQAWRARRSLRERTRAFAWLLTILRRRVFQEYGRARRERDWAAQFVAASEEAAEGPVGEMIDLARGLHELTAVHRDIVLLHALHGMSYEEIAAYLQVPLGTVMSRLARARDALRQLMETGKADNIVPFRKKAES